MKRNAILLLILLCILSSGCTNNGQQGSEQVVKAGDHITVNYTGRLEDGTVFVTSIEQIAIDSGVYNPQRNYEPLGFVAGTGRMIPGFDAAVIGMAVGDEKTVTIPPEDAYGACLPELIFDIPEEEFAAVNITPVIGQKVTYQRYIATITNISDGNVTLDCNHRLAGKTLEFTIELVSIEPAEQ